VRVRGEETACACCGECVPCSGGSVPDMVRWVDVGLVCRPCWHWLWDRTDRLGRQAEDAAKRGDVAAVGQFLHAAHRLGGRS
jgi:hypothetical protein